jgi:hypothetical protein
MSKARFGLKTRGEFTNCDGSSAVFGCSAQVKSWSIFRKMGGDSWAMVTGWPDLWVWVVVAAQKSCAAIGRPF